MHNSTFRSPWSGTQTLLVLSIVFIAAVLAPGSALADSSDSALDKRAIASLSKLKSISTTEAKQRLDVQARATEAADQLDRILGARAAGHYIDPASSKPVFQYARTSQGPLDNILVASTIKRFLLDQVNAEVRSVKYSTLELDRVASRIGAEFRANKSVRSGVRISTDTVSNQVLIRTANAEKSTLAREITSRLGLTADMFSIRQSLDDNGSMEKLTCSFPYCTKPMRGGVLIQPEENSSQFCTAGFIAKQGSARYLITAGHCGAVGTPWRSEVNINYPNFLSIGTMAVSYDDAYGDVGAIAMTGYWGENATGGYFADWRTGNPLGQTYATRTPLQGSFGCFHGAKSGSQCGTIRYVATQGPNDGGWVSHVLEANACGRTGDSGGPWIGPDNTLAGIVISGSDAHNPVPCSGPSNDIIYLQDARRAEERLGMQAEHRPAEMLPVSGDWDGNGTSTPGYFRPRTAQWFLSNSSSAPSTNVATNGVVWGTNTMIPVAGNWDGVGGDGIGLFDTVTAKWYLSNSATNPSPTALNGVAWGVSSMRPIAGNWDGVGGDGIGLFSPGGATWHLSNSSSNPNADAQNNAVWGTSEMRPVAGNWDGVGGDGIGLFHPPTAKWFLSNSVSSPTANVVNGAVWGTSAMRPFAGNWDGTGGDGVGLSAKSDGSWHFSNAVAPPSTSSSVPSWGTP